MAKKPKPPSKKSVLVVLVGKRTETAVKLQKILTAWGCLIKTRLGIHYGVMEECSESGLLILELHGEDTQKQDFVAKISKLPGLKCQLVELELDA
jgi:hypothetical protein